MDAVTLSGEDFKTIHNTLCDLRNLVGRMEQSMIKTSEFDRIIEGFQMGLKDAYAQDNTAFDSKMDYYREFQCENGLRSIWSIYELPLHGFLQDHPWRGARSLCYHDQHTAPILGATWGDLYRAADEVIRRSGDSHHIFIEGFYRWAKSDDSILGLTTGS
jgi:hypothetical protein